MRTIKILQLIKEEFPNARCELNYNNAFQLAVAVSLSAQTTDKRVNIVINDLFRKYIVPKDFAYANIKVLENDIRSIGLYKNKASNIISMAQDVCNKFNGNLPNNMNDLLTLKGVGRKTANVILSEYYKVPSIPVDTHVERVSKRLKIVPEHKNVLEIEKILERKIPKVMWIDSHHLMIFFGRYRCKAINPLCDDCQLISYCRYKG